MQAGLCPLCRHVRRVETRRGAIFLLCRRFARQPQYPKYPHQPVRECAGFERRDSPRDDGVGDHGS